LCVLSRGDFAGLDGAADRRLVQAVSCGRLGQSVDMERSDEFAPSMHAVGLLPVKTVPEVKNVREV
jgi:hypothetical protein